MHQDAVILMVLRRDLELMLKTVYIGSATWRSLDPWFHDGQEANLSDISLLRVNALQAG